MLIDTHAHLYWDSYKDDLDQVIRRATEADVATIINVGVDIERSRKALDQALKTAWPTVLQVYSTIGIHPHEAIKYARQTYNGRYINVQDDIELLEKIYRTNPKRVVAVGECGLDYLFGNIDSHVPCDYAQGPRNDEDIKALQRKLFQAQIDLAKELNLPLIVHCRDDRSKNPQNSEAWEEMLKMIGTHPAILHCYSGLPHTTNYVLHTTNLLVSFAATITYPKNEYLREAVKILPLEKIVLETDSPFLPPQSKRGIRNEPANVYGIAKLIADLKGISFEEVSNQTTKNVMEIFKLNPIP